MKANHWPCLAHNHTCMSTGTSTYIAHDFDMGHPPTRTGHIIGQHRQNEVSRFGERLPHQECPGLIALSDQLLSIWTGQVAMVPPEEKSFWSSYYYVLDITVDVLTIETFKKENVVCLFICELYLYFQHNENKLTSLMQTNPLKVFRGWQWQKKKTRAKFSCTTNHYSHEHKTRLDIYVTFILPACIYLLAMHFWIMMQKYCVPHAFAC